MLASLKRCSALPGHTVSRIAARRLVRLPRPQPVVVQRQCELAAQGAAHGVDARGVDRVAELLGHIAFARQREHQVLEGGREQGLAQQAAQGFGEGLAELRLGARAHRLDEAKLGDEPITGDGR